MTTSEPTTGEIVRALRYCADANSICGDACPAHMDEAGCRTVLMQNAADRLESQEQTIDELEDECGKLKMTINLLTARAESAERERDAAVEHIHDAIFGPNHSCFYCTMENCDGCTNSTVKEHFKYRGIHPNKYLVKQEYEQDGGAE